MTQPIIVTPRGGNVLVTVGGSTVPIDVQAGSSGPRGPQGPAGPQGPEGTINVVELTWAEYNALPVRDPQTVYVITDAAFVLLDRLAAVEARLAALEAAQP